MGHNGDMTTLLHSLLVTALAATPALAQTGPNAPNELVGQHYLITQDDLPAHYAPESVSNSGDLKPIPDPLVLNLPEGFTVNLFATGFDHARWLATAPNGDIFLAESRENGIVVLRDADGDGVAETESVYWLGMNVPTGMVFRDDGLYVADTQVVWRFAYGDGDIGADRAPLRMTVTDALDGSRGHCTRTLADTPDGSDFYVVMGSRDNESVESAPRAMIQIFEEGSGAARTFASGQRNAVGLAFHLESGELYTVVNERNGYGDDLVPDYFTRVRQDDFYGWPYAYSVTNPSPDYGDRAPELVAQSLKPDVIWRIAYEGP